MDLESVATAMKGMRWATPAPVRSGGNEAEELEAVIGSLLKEPPRR